MFKSRFLKEKKNNISISAILFVILVLIITILLILSAVKMNKSYQQECIDNLENAVKRISVHCYASQGKYPDNIEYIEKNYGLNYDKQKYIIHYKAFASNIMPQIVVVKRNDG
ncbi:MAG: hypothetical protein RSE93_06190 [Oscillospiraceae bacterium]